MADHKITALRKQRGSLYVVEREDEPTVELDRRTLDENGIAVGSELTDAEWEMLCALSAANRCRERALWLLSQRDYSRRELERKLRDVADREQAARTANRLVELGLVNDGRYAERLAREYCLVRRYPARRAAQKMMEKGLSREVIELALETVSADDVQQALAHLKKLCYTDTDNEETRRKLRDKLVRYGFSYETVKTAVRLLEEEGI